VEGIVFRVDEEQYNVRRAKVVRPDFIQGIQDSGHWMTRTVVKNQLRL
jgi:hypothetical protein